MGGDPMHSTYRSFEEKLTVALSSPALCRVILSECDLFSLGEVNVIQNDKILENDPLYNLLDRPNYFQTRRQFLWDYRFWNMIGIAYLLSDSKVLQNDPTLYWLDPSRLEFDQNLLIRLNKLYFSQNSIKSLENETVKYLYNDGTYTTFRLGDIKPFADVSNGLGNWYGSPSRIDAIYKIISNSEKTLDSKAINLHFSGKFMVAGKQNPEDVFENPLSQHEKESIEKATYQRNPVTAVKSMVDIKRYVSDMAALKLDESYESDMLAIGAMYGIPKELLDALRKGSTYENQEKALVRHISRTIQPKADDFASGLETFFGYDKIDKYLTITYDHLPEMQKALQEEKKVKKTDAETLKLLIDSGVEREDAARYLGMDIKFVKDEDNDQNPDGENE